MNSNKKILKEFLQGSQVERNPFWFMRQAGRFLPEYKRLRATTNSFLEFCYTPEKAAEATLQPIRRFGMDGAIIFSDILVIPDALGAEVAFTEGVGPVVKPVDAAALEKLGFSHFEKRLEPVYEALRLVKKEMPAETTLIGFAGAPWTLACYMLGGKSASGFEGVKQAAKNDREFFKSLISLLTKAVVRHIKNQVAAGAEVIQLFDSWAGLLGEKDYQDWVITPAAEIIAAVKAECNVPIIAFPRQSGIKFLAYAQATKADAISFDDSVPLEWVARNLQAVVKVQGCLDPEILAGDKGVLLAEAEKILDTLGGNFIFNLGHGVLPHTPVENMQALCEFLKAR